MLVIILVDIIRVCVRMFWFISKFGLLGLNLDCGLLFGNVI